MVHASKIYKYASYEEYRDNGMFSTEANCMQFLYDIKNLRTNHQCPRCLISMNLQERPTSKYREGACWKCKCGQTIAPRIGSILENSNITYEEFIKILASSPRGICYFCSSTWKPCKGYSSETPQKDAPANSRKHRRTWNSGGD